MAKASRWIVELGIIVAAVLLIRATIVQAFNIPSASMQPTLLIGDFILVNKLVYRFSDPRRGDIVVFKYPKNPSLDYIKRIIALPGDKVEFRLVKDADSGVTVYRVFVNGKGFDLLYRGLKQFNGRFYHEYIEVMPYGNNPVEHTVLYTAQPYKVAGLVNFREEWCLEMSGNLCTSFVVPEGAYFVMGDNRDNSEDSRFWGFVPRDYILGKAFVIYFSGRVPSLTPKDVGFFTGFRQLFIALLNPRPERIGIRIEP